MATWDRSRAHGADAQGDRVAEEGIVDTLQLADALARSEDLRRSASNVLHGFAAACAANDYVAVLADADGVVVETYIGNSFAREAERLRLIEGAAWAESLRGTNAIGTALAESRPVAVTGAAHFARVNEDMACFASPIRSPRGEIVGVLDATSTAERASLFDLGVVVSMARAVEEVLRAREYSRTSGGIALVERLMEHSRGAAFLVERPGRIARANAPAKALQKILEERVGHHRFLPDWGTLVARAAVSRSLRVHCSPVHRGAHGRTLQRVPIDLTVEPISDAEGEILALIVFADSAVDSHDVLTLPLSAAREEKNPSRTRLRTSAPPKERPAQGHAFRRILGSDAALASARDTCERLAQSNLPVLLLAETGTGKELFARAIHDASARVAQSYVAVNCGAIQPALLLSELFGHGPGAYTGAARAGRDGLIAAAHGGTLFLDEVADLPAEAQVALLRVLEDGTYFRVGEASQRRSDIRIVAATSRDLRALVDAGSFREDLFFRIGGACVGLPPLRDRSDFEELAVALWTRVGATHGGGTQRLSADVLACLGEHTWPGNVRELESALEFAAAMAGDEPEVRCDHLPSQLGSTARAPAAAAKKTPKLPALDAARHDALVEALREANGNVSEAARRLGVARSTIYRLSRRLGLDR